MLTRHVNRTYRNSNIVVRTKAPAVLAVLLFIVVLVPVPVVTNLLDGDYLFAVILTVLEIAMIVSLVMLLRGRFRVATAVPLLVTLLAMTGMAFLLDVESLHQTSTVVTYMVAPLALSLVISENEWYTLAVALIGLFVILGSYFLVIAPAAPPVDDTPPIIGATLLYVLIGVFAFQVARMTGKAMVHMEGTNARNEATLQKIGTIMNEAGSSLDAIKSVESNYRSVLERVEDIRARTERFAQTSGTLREGSDRAVESAENTAERARGFHTQVDEQNTVVEETTASVTEMSASLDSVAGTTAEKREVSDRLFRIAEEGLKELEATNEALQSTSKEMQKLHEINELVGDIAERTNLLSMNASIEAAHAGSHGLGFAVVADEIRKLATTTGQNSRDISENLKKMMDLMNATNEHAQRTTESMNQITDGAKVVSEAFSEIASSASELSQGGREIMSAMEVLQKSSTHIKEGSDEIAAEQDSVRKGMHDVAGFVEEIESSTGEILRAVDFINESMNELHETIDRSSRQTAQLNESVAELTSNTSSEDPAT